MKKDNEGHLRVVKDGEELQYPKASLFLRICARAVDALMAWILYRGTSHAGLILAFLFILFADGLGMGQSPGKKLFGIKAIFLPTGQGVRNRDSVLRNAPLAFIIILSMMPEIQLQAFVVGLVFVGIFEGVAAIRDPQGRRLGDIWAQTQVVDAKEVSSQSAPVRDATMIRAESGRLRLIPSAVSVANKKREEEARRQYRKHRGEVE